MAKHQHRTTWDGKPIAASPPFGATVVVYRTAQQAPEVLLLHRAHEGPDFEGDWAWTPPSGARYPGEGILDCAERELREETGLELHLIPIKGDQQEWLVFAAEMSGNTSITLSEEHDRYEWVTADKAVEMCKPDMVSRAIRAAFHGLGLGSLPPPD